MNVTVTSSERTNSRTNRRRQSRARVLGRVVGFPPSPSYRRGPMHVPSFASSWPRLSIA
jgi:hypothetical protein